MMPPAKDPIWKHFLTGERQNKSHIWVHCCGCIEKECLENKAIELDNDGKPKLSSQSWVIEGK